MVQEISKGKYREHQPYWMRAFTSFTYVGDGTTTGRTIPIDGNPDSVNVVESGTSTEYVVDDTGSLVSDATDGVTETTDVVLDSTDDLVVGDGSTDGNIDGTEYTVIGIDVGLL